MADLRADRTRPPQASPGIDDDDEPPEPPRLRALRRLVTLLTTTAIIGVAVVAGTLVLRLSQPLTPPLSLDAISAERIAAPPGETVTAAGAAPGALILVTRDAEGVERMRLYDAATGALSRTVTIERAAR